mgnify:CR=1 FL=1
MRKIFHLEIMNAIEQLNNIKGQLSYVNNVLSIGGLEAWEAKEYSNLAKEYEEEIVRLTNHIESNIEIFASSKNILKL